MTDAQHDAVNNSPSIHLIDFDAINCSSPAPMIFRSSFVETIKIKWKSILTTPTKYEAVGVDIQSDLHIILEGNLEMIFHHAGAKTMWTHGVEQCIFCFIVG
jgi:hypothetical protein